MNKLKTVFSKGVPFEWDDIDWFQESVRDAFYGLLTAFGVSAGDSFIISGCSVVITDLGGGSYRYTWTDGWIAYKGEICKVVASSVVPSVGDVAYWSIVETNDSSGAEKDSDDNTVQCYKIRQGALVGGVTPAPGTYMPYNAETLANKITAIVEGTYAKKTQPSWILPGLANGWAHKSGAGYSSLMYRKNELGYLELKGHVDPSGVTGQTLFTLPAGYRPAHNVDDVAFYSTNGILQIDTSGNVKIPGYQTGYSYYFINFRIPLV